MRKLHFSFLGFQTNTPFASLSQPPFISFKIRASLASHMDFRTLILTHFLVISLGINVGFLYRDYSDGKDKDFRFKNQIKNSSLLSLFSSASKEGEEAQVHSEIIDLDHGDPKMYEKYWRRIGDRSTVVIPGWKFISYFSDVGNICWFLEPEFASSVTRLHKLVGNAVTDNRHIVVGTGSTQLIQAALYAVVSQDTPLAIPVVSAAPYYSSYPLIIDVIKSTLYRWGGCAHKLKEDDEMYIELVTYPNNPDGAMRKAVVNGSKGILIHDLAYYWPQYTPIVSQADHDIMLFTVSKSTGHAGTRLGWAIVKDPEIARKMTEFIILTTIGVSKDSQYRASKIIQVLCDTHEQRGNFMEIDPFFEHGFNFMAKRWRQLRNVVQNSKLFSLPEFPRGSCTFSGRSFSTQPAFAWVKCEGSIDDCESFLHKHKILTRSGKHFGESEKYVRISVLPTDEVFEQFTERLSTITTTPTPLSCNSTPLC